MYELHPRAYCSMMCCALIALCLQVRPAGAQSQSLTLEDAVKIALSDNVELRQQQIEAARDDVELSEARMRFAPDLRVGASGLQSTGRVFNDTEGEIVERRTRSLNVDVVSRLTLFNGFHDVANLKRADLQRAAGRLELEWTEESVIFAVVDDFLALIIWQEASRVQREYLAGEVELEQQLQDYVAAGARAAADLHQQQVNVAAARGALVEAENGANLATIELMRTLQLDPAGVYDFKAPARDAPTETVELQVLLSRAWENRADLRAMESRSQAARQRIRMASASYWPTLTLDSGYGSRYTDASATRFNDQLDQQRTGLMSLSVSIPLFDRNVVRNAVRRAELEARSVDISLEETRELVGLQVRRAYLDYQTARERIAAAQQQAGAAERAAQSAQERFRAGAYSLVELTKARSDLVAARGALARAEVLLSFQKFAVDYVAGDIDTNGYR